MKKTELVYLFGVLFLFFLLLVDETNANEIYQKFNLVGGSEIFSITSRESIEYLAANKQAPEFVFQPFQVGTESIWQPVRVLSLLWKPEEVEAEELTLYDQIDYYISAIATKWGQ